MDLAQFIDTYKEAIAQRVVESYPPLYRPSQNGHTACPNCSAPPWEPRPTPYGASPSPSRPTRAPTSWGDGHRQDLQCAALRGIGSLAQLGRTRRKFLGQPTHLEAKA